MKKSIIKNAKAILAASIIALPVFFSSCGEDSGLGATVDTEAPSLSISYPPIGAVIREAFYVAGSCNDDKEIKSIKISVVNVETKAVVEEREAEINGEKWSAKINLPLGSTNEFGLTDYTYKDGKYEISATAYDKVGHTSGKNSRTVEVDNTPPIFFITSPQIDDISDVTNYGTKLKITGTIADAHKVAQMKVIVYDEDGNIVADSESNPITVNNISTAGGTSETIASYVNSTATSELNNNYISIYFNGDDSKSGTQNYTCRILLSDEAELYQTPFASNNGGNSAFETAALSSGNSTGELFAYYNIRDTVGSDVFDANTLMQVINGTYSGENLDLMKSALLTDGFSQTSAKFTLNPKANPTYSVIGFGFDGKETTDSAWSESTLNAKFTLVATQGLNQDAIDKNSARTYLVGPFTPEGGVGSFNAKYSEILNKLSSDMEDLSDKYEYESIKDSDADKAQKKANNTATFEKYLQDNSEYLSANGITYFKELELSGTATGSGESYNYPYTLPDALPQANSIYLFFATGRDKEGLAFINGDNFNGFKLTITGNKPTFKNVHFEKNLASSSEIISPADFTNSADLILKGQATSDSGIITSVAYKLTVTDEASNSDSPVYTSGSNSINCTAENIAIKEFDFNLFDGIPAATKNILTAEGKRYLYTVDLTTNANPGGEFSTQYVVHIDSKKPVIELTKVEPVYVDTDGKSWISGAGLSRFRGSVDEENPKKVSYEVRKNGTNVNTGDLTGVFSFDLTSSDGGALSGITLTDGDYVDVTVSAEDKAGNKSEQFLSDKYYADVTKPVLIKTDEDGSDKPKAIRIDGTEYVNGEPEWRKSTALSFEGWYNEKESGVAALYYIIDPTEVPANGSEIKNYKKAIGVDSNGKFSSIISGFKEAGGSKIYLVAEDNVGNLSEIDSYEVYIDQNGPVFTEVEKSKRNLPANGTQDIKFEIKVEDQTDASGIDESSVSVIAIYNGTQYKLSDEENSFSKSYNKTSGILTGTIKKEYISASTHSTVDSNGHKLNEKFDGNVTLLITVSDKAGNSSSNQQYILQVDSSAPLIEITAPAAVSDSETNVQNISWITGKTNLQGSISDVGVSGVDTDNFKFLIPTIEQQNAINALAAGATVEAKLTALGTSIDEWKDFTKNNGVTWSIQYDSSYLEAANHKGKNSLVYYGAANSSGTLTYATKFSNKENESRYRTVPIYFLVADKAGNKDVITGNKFYIDVEGGKPKISISYPKDKTDSEGNVTSWAKLSEEVALQGTAQDNEAVTKVALKELYYATKDANTVFASPELATNWTQIQSEDVDLIAVADVTLTKSESGNLTIDQAVSGTSVVEPYDIEFNLTKLAQTLALSSKKITAIKAIVSVEDENEYSYTAVRYAFIDTETPALYDEKIVKLAQPLADGVTKISSLANGKLLAGGQEYNVLVERKYEADMWLSGANSANWYYVATVKDDSTIESVNLSSQSGIEFAKDITIATADLDDAGEGYVSYTFAIPIPAGEDGNMYSKLTRNDGAHKDVNSYISLNIDNTAPAMRNTKEKFVTTFTSTDALKLVSDGDLGEKYVVENSNGSFSFGDQVQEKGSGLAFIGFWFERNSKKTVYNPVIRTGADNTYKAGVAESDRSTAVYVPSKVSGSIYLNDDNFPALYVASSASGLTFSTEEVDGSKFTAITYTDLGTNPFINRAYGMVKINGSYYKIQKVDGNKIILNSNLELSAKVDVEFIYANFVDHIGTETYTLSADGSSYEVSNDDDSDNSNGDGIVESLKVKSGVYTWTAEFDSNNMSDGPARINIVTMDNAGNMSYGYVDTSIQNNRPRIAKVFLATDLDGSGKFDFYSESDGFGTKINPGDAKYDAKNPNRYDLDSLEVENGSEFGEFMFFSALDEDGNSQALATVKDKGVNSNFIVMDKFLILPEIVGGNSSTENPLKYTYNVVDKADDVAVTKSSEALSSFVSGTALTSVLNKKEGSLYDVNVLPAQGILFGSNDETNGLGKYESWTQTGTTESKTSKFFGFTIWDATGIDDSSIKQGENTLWALLSLPVVVNVKDDIAPKPVITPFYWNSKDDSSTVYDENEQPEGHIDYLDADGNVMAKPGLAGKIYLEGYAKDDSRVEAIYITDPSGTKTLAAVRKNGWKVTASDISEATESTVTWPATWKSFEITGEEEPTQKGNTVYWRLTIDTSDYGVAENKIFTVTAEDKSNNSSTPGTVQTTSESNTDYYKVDFVPYIKSISLSDGTSLRSRLGRYSVRSGENIVINGMNFGTSGNATVHFYKSNTKGSQGDEVGSGTSVTISNNTVTIPAPDYSRFVAVTVNGQTTQNNINSNERGYNIEEGYVIAKKDSTLGKATASKAGTNFWTDDRYIAVWNVETTFPGSINPHSGVIKKVTEDNSPSGKVYTTENGSGAAAVDGKTDGYIATLSSDDLRYYIYDDGNSAKKKVLGQNETDIFTVPVDAMDMTIVNGIPYFVGQDNYLGNVDANCWGAGLFLARSGWVWDKNNINGTNTPDEGKYTVFIEKQGKTDSAKNRNSSNGYDSVLYQFKNPRIAGWNKDAKEIRWTNNGGYSDQYGSSTDYIYISYYDSYARCLKYAAYRAGEKFDGNGYLEQRPANWGPDMLGNGKGDLQAEMRSANGNMNTGKTVVAGFDTLNNNPTQFKEEAGEWSDIMVDVTTENDPHPVIIYYNKTKKSLEVAYGKQAFPTHDGNIVTSGSAYDSGTDNSEGAEGWTKYKGITPSDKVDFGRYVSATMDSNGNLHVAAQDATNAKLYYMFLEKSNNYKAKYTAIVDAANGAGRWTDIELTNPKGTSLTEIKPVISYINTSFLGTTQGVKTAYLESVSGTGSSATLNFETITDPAKWQAGDQRTSVLPDVKEEKTASGKAIVGVGFNSDMLALDFLRGEN